VVIIETVASSSATSSRDYLVIKMMGARFALLCCAVLSFALAILLFRGERRVPAPSCAVVTEYPVVVLPALPCLDPANRSTYALWHAYYERVCQEAVTEPVCLDRFTFFYHFSPILQTLVYPKPADARIKEMAAWPHGSLLRFVGSDPEAIVTSRAGLFVKRPLDFEILDSEFLEVIREKEPSEDGRECWFYHSIGSGFWIKSEGATKRTFESQANGSNPEHLTEFVMRVPDTLGANDEEIEVYRGAPGKQKRCPAVYDSLAILTGPGLSIDYRPD
jgi:hypothetical protein